MKKNIKIKIAGLDDEANKIKKLIDIAFNNWEQMEKVGLTPVRGVLISGPQGIGKSLLAKYVLSLYPSIHSQIIKSHELLSRVVGDGEKKVESIFSVAKES